MKPMNQEGKRLLFKRIFCALTILAFLISLVPLTVEAKYNLPISDDITVMSVVEKVWDDTGSVSAFLSACVQDGVRYYNTWQGTYTANFVVEILDVLLLRQHPMLTPVIGMALLIAAVTLLFWVALRRILKTDVCTFLTITFLTLFLMIQFCPSVYEAFYWLFAMLLYGLSFSCALALLGALLAARRAGTTLRKVLWYALALICTLYIGGGTQVLLPAMALVLLWDLVCCLIQRRRLDTVLVAVLFCLHLAGTVLNVTAPGNFARLDFETGAAAAAMSPVKAVALSCVHAFGEVLNRLDPAMALFMLATAALTLPYIKDSGYSFKKPWLALLLSFGIYASLFTALIYTKNHVGPLRVQNLYYFALYPFMGFNTVYCLGAYLRAEARRGERAEKPGGGFLGSVYRRPVLTVAVVLCLVFAAVVQRGLQKTWSYAAYQDLSSGWARDYYGARVQELDGTNPTATESVVRPNIIDGN